MDFQLSPRAKELQQRLLAFFDEHIYPNEETYDAQMAAFGISGGGGIMRFLMSHPPLDVRIAALRDAGRPEQVSPVRRM